jgi:hypothetical protein
LEDLLLMLQAVNMKRYKLSSRTRAKKKRNKKTASATTKIVPP